MLIKFDTTIFIYQKKSVPYVGGLKHILFIGEHDDMTFNKQMWR